MKRSLALAFCLAVAPEGGAFAQPAQSLDVLGVRLGAQREAAVHLLTSRKPPYVVTNTNGLNVENLGASIWHVSLNANKPDVVDSVDLDFAPPPTASTVLRIYHNVCYNCSVDHKTSADAPSLEIFQRSIAEKLGASTPTVLIGRSLNGRAIVGESSVYIWTPAGQLLSPAEFSRRLRYPARCYNPPVLDAARTNMGVSFFLNFDDQNYTDTCGTVVLVHWQQLGGIVTQFDMTFSDVAGLVSAFAKSDALLRAKLTSQHQQVLQHANQSKPNL